MSLIRPTYTAPLSRTTPSLLNTVRIPFTDTIQSQRNLRSFSSTPIAQKKKGQQKRDVRITAIRYFLHHPLTPRPLRFSRTRFLRHWTIHRAWQRYQDKLRHDRQLELERQYNSMAEACEQLRLIDGDGMTHEERIKLGQKPIVSPQAEGRLYRLAMLKNGIWKGVPIEYARIQTETPAREGWNHGWTR
ncbi:hypothetical protein CERZMDRAFT_69335 [Cercospora zeae-maydis SCOH1-5]|uniref:Large ribosomal subunit protein mL40 n=1 Tax=Cercospora zeae-maydis SCOH1-5 TaxID=717836 RepID=A0A6A6FBS4_9PEZI|nr:hypothetical protein CERZMDRAFT_69335 [Cercospora zeae-maydis SCOH1-5]